MSTEIEPKPTPLSGEKLSLQQCHVMNKQEKKQAYNAFKWNMVHFYTSGVFKQPYYGKSVRKVLLAFGTTDIWKERPSAVDFK